MAGIALDDLTKHYGQVEALGGITLTVEEGEIFGFLGPNGAGKSTTIDILLDFVRPTSGSASVLGFDCQRESMAVRKRVGVLPDAFHVYDRLTGRQHLEFVVESKGVDDDPEALLERVDVAEAADRRAGGYSKGMKQRLTLAMALVGDPDVLVLDEPTTGLDPNGAREMRELIREEAARGTTVFFSSHILEQVQAVCDRVGILNDGELVAVDSIEGLRDSRGRGSTLRVTTDRADEETVSALSAIDGVEAVRLEGRTYVLRVLDAAKADVVTTLVEAGHEVRDFTTVEDSLEDLFASYTGEEVPG